MSGGQFPCAERNALAAACESLARLMVAENGKAARATQPGIGREGAHDGLPEFTGNEAHRNQLVTPIPPAERLTSFPWADGGLALTLTH